MEALFVVLEIGTGHFAERSFENADYMHLRLVTPEICFTTAEINFLWVVTNI